MKSLIAIFLVFACAANCQAQSEKIFRSAQHHFRLVYPPNWAHKAIKDPNIVTKGSKDGIYINVSVVVTPGFSGSAHELTKDDVVAMLSEQKPPQELISFDKQFIDAVPAMMHLSRVHYKTLDAAFTLRMVQYSFFRDGKLFTVSGTAADNLFDQKLPEIRRVISTFKFEDHLYK